MEMEILQKNKTAASELNFKEKQNRFWTVTEHQRFLKALELYVSPLVEFSRIDLARRIRRQLVVMWEREQWLRSVPIYKSITNDWYFSSFFLIIGKYEGKRSGSCLFWR